MSSDDTVPPVRYLDPVYHELAQLRAEVADLKMEAILRDRVISAYEDRTEHAEAALDQAEERINNLTDALDRRTATQNATGEANDALVRRAIAAERTIELARDLADTWETIGPDETMSRRWASECLLGVLGQ